MYPLPLPLPLSVVQAIKNLKSSYNVSLVYERRNIICYPKNPRISKSMKDLGFKDPGIRFLKSRF